MISRRQMLSTTGMGFGALALNSLMPSLLAGIDQESRSLTEPLKPRKTHHQARAKNVIFLFMEGGPSHIDLFDFKPELSKLHGQASDFGEPVEAFQNGLGPWMKPLWDFKPYGESGKMLSDVVAPLGDVVDEVDHQLGHEVARSRLPSEDDRPGDDLLPVLLGQLLDGLVAVDDASRGLTGSKRY